jgi:membrane protease YdiL (CAAX protease family)
MDSNEIQEDKKLPFNNLFLNAGYVNGQNEWWMYVFGICAAMLGYFLFQLVMVLPLISAAISNGVTLNEIQSNPELLFNPDKTGVNKNLLLALLFSMFVFALIALMSVVKFLHKKVFLSVITAYDSFRFGRFFFGFLIWGILIVTITVVGYYTNKDEISVQFDPYNFSMLVLVTVLLMPIQTSTEEIIFRGYLIQGLAQIFKNGIVPLIITSVLFGLVHMSNPEAKAFGWLTMLPYYTAFGFFLGAITLLDEGLELALGIHCANNLISSLLITSPNGVLKTDAIFVTKTENPGAEFITWVILATITFIIFWQKYRWKNFNLLIK